MLKKLIGALIEYLQAKTQRETALARVLQGLVPEVAVLQLSLLADELLGNLKLKNGLLMMQVEEVQRAKAERDKLEEEAKLVDNRKALTSAQKQLKIQEMRDAGVLPDYMAAKLLGNLEAEEEDL